MSLQSTLILRNDACDEIIRDCYFGDKIVNAINKSVRPMKIKVGEIKDAITLIETHNSDNTLLIAAGNNDAKIIGTLHQYTTHSVEDSAIVRILRLIAKDLGYDISDISVRKTNGKEFSKLIELPGVWKQSES